MEFIPTPDQLKVWDMAILDKLLEQKIESESLDFKVRINELSNHICAMANTVGGFLVLGIKETKSPDGKIIIRFEKEGIRENEKNTVEQQIRESIANVEPVPMTGIKLFSEGDRHYIVLEVKSENPKKPFFTKNKCQCFVRIRDSTYPATRLMIYNMFQNSISMIKNIQKLRSTTAILKGELESTIEYVKSISSDEQTRPSTIDLGFIKDAIYSNYDFLLEQNLVGDKDKGFIHVISTIGKMNSQINAYNTILTPTQKNEIRYMIVAHEKVLASELRDVIVFLGLIILHCDTFLTKNPIIKS